MGLMVGRGKDFQIATEGAHQGTLAAIVDVGEVENSFGKIQDVMRFIWLIDEVDEETGEPLMVFQRIPKSTHEKSNFSKTVRGITGKNPPEDYDALDLLGSRATLMIEHNEKEGRTYGNVILVTKAAKGVDPVEIPADWQPPKARKGEGQTYPFGATAANAARSQAPAATQQAAVAAEVSDEDILF